MSNANRKSLKVIGSLDSVFVILLILGCVFLSCRSFTAYAVQPKWYWLVGTVCLWGIYRLLRPGNSSNGRSSSFTVDWSSVGQFIICLYILLRLLASEPVRILWVCITVAAFTLFCIVGFTANVTSERAGQWACILAGGVLSGITLWQWFVHAGAVREITGPFDSPAGLAICIAALFPFLLTEAFRTRGKYRIPFAILLSLNIAAVALTQSRTGVIAVAVVSGIFLYGRYAERFKRRLKYPKAILSVILLALVAASVFINTDSAKGRLLVWRITGDMVAERPLFGGGNGVFAARYMDAQADFFREHPDHPTAMLADNVSYPFNEYLGFAAEYGWMGLGLCLLWVLLIVYRAEATSPYLLCLVAVGIASLFSYPFRYASTLLLVVWSLACLARKRPQGGFARTFRLSGAIRIILALCLTGCQCLMATDMRFEYRWGRLSRNTVNPNADTYRELNAQWNGNPAFLYTYGSVLFHAGRYEECLPVLLSCRRYLDDYDVRMLLGACYENLEKPSEAEKHYLQASLMCPNRFMPLYKLVGVYDSIGRPDRALDLAREIVGKPEKVPSGMVAAIKLKMRQRAGCEPER